MFYSDQVLVNKGPFASIWLAANWDRKLTKSQIVQTNIQSSVHDILNGNHAPMALRLSGQLLLGASRIYWRKARYLLEDCNETLDRLKLNFKVDGQVDMPQDQSRAPISSITLATNYTTVANNLMLPEPDLDLDEILNMVATQQPQAGGKPGNGKENENSINLKEKFNVSKNFGFDKSDQNDSILQAFPMNEDFEIETGRRLTDLSSLGMSRDSNPFISRDSISTSAFGLEDPSGIEVGRRESVASAYSPMRLSTPGKAAAEEEHMDFDINDNFAWDANEEQAVASPAGAVPFDTPPRPVAAKSTRKRKVALDEVTELSNTQIQKQVKDTSDIILAVSGTGKRAALEEAGIAAADESRRLSLNSLMAPQDAAAILARPAFDGDMLMDAFGDLFKDNPLAAAVSSVTVGTPAVNRSAPAVLQSEMTPIQNTFADMNDDHMYEDMNPEMPFFEAETVVSHESTSTSIQLNIFEIISTSRNPVAFHTIVANQTRSSVSKSFFDVLALSSKGLISASQSEAFGQITLTNSAN